MKITSPVFENNQPIPKKYSCDQEGINPPLNFSDVPQDVKSFVLIVDDPDAPNGTFIHWVVYNIDPTIKEVGQNSVPSGGSLGMTSSGSPQWVPPCPPASNRGEPSGTHRYFFKLYALDNILNLAENPGKEVVEKAMDGHILEQAQLIGLYSRS